MVVSRKISLLKRLGEAYFRMIYWYVCTCSFHVLDRGLLEPLLSVYQYIAVTREGEISKSTSRIREREGWHGLTSATSLRVRMALQG